MDFPIRFQVSMFADASSIDSGSRSFMKMADAFKDQEIVPATIQEVMPNGHTAQRLSVTPRGSDISVNILHNRLDAIWPPLVPDGSTRKIDLEEFLGKAIDSISKISEAYFLKGNRLALVCEYIYNCGPENSSAIRDKINPNLYQSLNSGERLEWVTRQVVRVEKILESEPLNFSVEFSEAKGEMFEGGRAIAIEGIRRHIDINTLRENTTPRFFPGSLAEFCEEAKSMLSKKNDTF